MLTDRRSCVRHKVHGPAFASFDGVTGGMILDLSEQGLSMQTMVPMEAERRVQLRLGLPDSDAQLETTGYIAWADALGRAGVRFSELPEEARQRLDHWLALNDETPSRKAPKLTFDSAREQVRSSGFAGGKMDRLQSISLEAESGAPENDAENGAENLPENGANRSEVPLTSNTIQYEFHSLGSDLNDALKFISERARSLLRGTGAAIAITDRGP